MDSYLVTLTVELPDGFEVPRTYLVVASDAEGAEDLALDEYQTRFGHRPAVRRTELVAPAFACSGVCECGGSDDCPRCAR